MSAVRLEVHFPLDLSWKTDDLVCKTVGRQQDYSGSNGCSRDMGWKMAQAEAEATASRLRDSFPNMLVEIKPWDAAEVTVQGDKG